MSGRIRLRDSHMPLNTCVNVMGMSILTYLSVKLYLSWLRRRTHLVVLVETNGDPRAATIMVAAMEARATVEVATNLKAAMVDQAVAVAMEAVVVTVMRAPAEQVATAEATTLAAAQAVVVAPTGEVATRTLASTKVAATAVVMVAAAVVAAAATTTIRRALLMGVELSHHRLALLDLNPVVAAPHRIQQVAAIRSSLATLTSQLMRIL